MKYPDLMKVTDRFGDSIQIGHPVSGKNILVVAHSEVMEEPIVLSFTRTEIKQIIRMIQKAAGLLPGSDQ